MPEQTKGKQNVKGEEEELQELLKNYLRKSEELEDREARVLRQIELMQSATASLQAWNESRKTSLASDQSERLNLNEIDEETRKIKEETKRIQEEIQKKIEDNKILKEEIKRRKMLQDTSEQAVSGALKEEKSKKKPQEKAPKIREFVEEDFDTEIKLFDKKVQQLKEIEGKLRKESEMKAEESKKKQEELRRRIRALEKESQPHKNLSPNFKK